MTIDRRNFITALAIAGLTSTVHTVNKGITKTVNFDTMRIKDNDPISELPNKYNQLVDALEIIFRELTTNY